MPFVTVESLRDLVGRYPLATRALVVLLFGAAVLLPRLGAPPIMHDDEGRYIGMAIEALDFNEWVTPLVEGKFDRYYGRPPVGYGAAAVSSLLFGFTKAAFRLPFAIAGLFTLFFILLIGERLRPNAGLIAALLLAASPGWAEHTRRIWLETFFLPMELGGIWLLWRAESRRWMALAAGLLFAGALLTKQVAGGVGLASVSLVWLLWRRDAWRQLLLVWIAACVPFVLWLVLYVNRVGDDAASLLTLHVLPRLVGGHPEARRVAGDFIDGWYRLLGWPTLLGGIAGTGLLLARAAGRNEMPVRLLERSLLLYMLVHTVVHGLWSDVFRYWYTFPPAHIVALGAGLLTAIALQHANQRPGERWPLALAVASGFAIVHTHVYLDNRWLLAGSLAIAAALATCAAAKATQALFTRLLPVIAPLALGAALLCGFGASLNHNVLAPAEDKIEAAVQTIRARGIDELVLEPYFFRNEFLYYLRDLRRTRVARGKACIAAPQGKQYAYFAIDNPPACWRQISGTRGRFRNVRWVIMAPKAQR